jgi:hypothetical protein
MPPPRGALSSHQIWSEKGDALVDSQRLHEHARFARNRLDRVDVDDDERRMSRDKGGDEQRRALVSLVRWEFGGV